MHEKAGGQAVRDVRRIAWEDDYCNSFQTVILRAVLRQVSPMVIRLLSVPDHMGLAEFHDAMRAILGWHGDLGYIVRVHGQEFNSFRRKTRFESAERLAIAAAGEVPLHLRHSAHVGVGYSGLGY